MEDRISYTTEQLLAYIPGGIAKLALDDELTIIYATNTFYSLIKNVSDKINTKLPQTLLKIVYSADIIFVTRQLAAQKHRKDNMLSIKFRTLQQDGSFRWVMITGSKSEEMFSSGGKQVNVYSCIAIDLTEHMQEYKKLEQANEYHRTITELAKELYFEYEIAADTLSFTELFRDSFGKDSKITEFRNRLQHTKLIHPDELHAVIKIFNSMMAGKKQVRFEVRLINKEGNPVGYICYASIIFDENRNPYKVVGKLLATNCKKNEAEPSSDNQEIDILTKVSTLKSAEKLIIEAMARQEEDSLSALLAIEVRNHKEINDVLRTVDGDDILYTMAGLLKNHIRTTDVIGTSGAGEFIIYLKDIRTDKCAYEKAEIICNEAERLYSYKHAKKSLIISIGIAFRKGDSIEYPALLVNARQALKIAKSEDFNTFSIFYD